MGRPSVVCPSQPPPLSEPRGVGDFGGFVDTVLQTHILLSLANFPSHFLLCETCFLVTMIRTIPFPELNQLENGS